MTGVKTRPVFFLWSAKQARPAQGGQRARAIWQSLQSRPCCSWWAVPPRPAATAYVSGALDTYLGAPPQVAALPRGAVRAFRRRKRTG